MPSFGLCLHGHVLVLGRSRLVMIHEHGAGGEEHQSMSRGLYLYGTETGGGRGKGGWRGKGLAWVRNEWGIYGCRYCLVSVIMMCVKGETVRFCVVLRKSRMPTWKFDEVELCHLLNFHCSCPVVTCPFAFFGCRIFQLNFQFSLKTCWLVVSVLCLTSAFTLILPLALSHTDICLMVPEMCLHPFITFCAQSTNPTVYVSCSLICDWIVCSSW